MPIRSWAASSFVALLWAAFTPPACAQTLLAGYGRGNSAEAATAEARQDLSSRLSRRAAERFKGASGDAAIPLASGRELPLVGIELAGTGGGVEARLTSASLAAYRSEAARLGESLQMLRRKGLAQSPDAKSELSRALAQIDQYRRVQAVLGALGAGTPPQAGPDDATLRQWALVHLPAIDQARIAPLIRTELERSKVSGVRVVAPVRADTGEITGLSGSIADALRAEVGASTPDRPARYTLDGRYELFERRILLTLYLMDASFSTARAFAYLLPGDAEKAFRSPPAAAAFSRTLSRGLVRIESLEPGDLPAAQPQGAARGIGVDVQTGRGNRALYYRPGDRDRLLVKLDRPGYYYVVGHVEKENARLSYLMEIGGAGSTRPFVRAVGQGEVNRWQTVGEFTVEPPLGREAVQVFASSELPTKILPATRFDSAKQLHVIGNDPVDAIKRTRGLVRVDMEEAQSASGSKAETSPAFGEAVLQFSTLQ